MRNISIITPGIFARLLSSPLMLGQIWTLSSHLIPTLHPFPFLNSGRIFLISDISFKNYFDFSVLVDLSFGYSVGVGDDWLRRGKTLSAHLVEHVARRHTLAIILSRRALKQRWRCATSRCWLRLTPSGLSTSSQLLAAPPATIHAMLKIFGSPPKDLLHYLDVGYLTGKLSLPPDLSTSFSHVQTT